MLFKEFGGVDAWPICLATTDVDEIVAAVAAIAPGFGGINLEDIAAPRCFEIERRLRETPRHPGLPRRPARHGRRGARRAPERAARRRQAARGRQGGRRRRRRGGRRDHAASCSPPASARIVGCDREGAVYAGARRASSAAQAAYAELTNPDGERGTVGRGAGGRGRVHRRLGARPPSRAEAIGRWPSDAIVFAMANPDARGRPGGDPTARRGDRDRALRLPEPDQQRARVSRGSSAARSTSAPPRSPRR